MLVTATFLDPLGRPMAGRVVFTPSAAAGLTVGGRPAVLAPGAVTGTVRADGVLVSLDGTADLTLEPCAAGYDVVCYLTTADGQYATFPLEIPGTLASVDLGNFLIAQVGMTWAQFDALTWTAFAAVPWQAFAA